MTGPTRKTTAPTKEEHEKQKEDWLNISKQLKELNNDEIPNSQTFIDWNLSEEEENKTTGKKRKLNFKTKQKYTYKRTSDFSPNDEIKYSKSPENINSSNKYAKSPILMKAKRDLPKIRSSVSPKFKIISTPTYSNKECAKSPVLMKSKIALPKIITCRSPNFEIISTPICKTNREVHGDTNPKACVSITQTNSSKESSTDEFTPEETSLSYVSPVLKSRLKTQHSIKNSVSRKKCLSTLLNNTDEVIDLSKSDNFECESDQNDNTIHSKSNIEKAERLLRPSSSLSKENDLVISECQSPCSNRMKEMISYSSSPSMASNRDDEGVPLEAVPKPRGSDWVKDIQCKTPQKGALPHTAKGGTVIDVPDSSKKKIKRNGFAVRLQKLIQSWQSSAYMWHHQMTSESRRGLYPSSSHPTSNPARETALKSSPCPSDISVEEAVTTQPIEDNVRYAKTTSQGSSKAARNHSPLCPVQDDPHRQSRSLKKRRSLEISPLSESPLATGSDGAKFETSNKCHLWVVIVNIQSQNSTMVSALCKETGSPVACKVNQPPSVPKMLLVIFGFFQSIGPLSVKQLNEGSKVQIFAPWQLLEAKNLSIPTLFSSRYLVMEPNTSQTEAEHEHKPYHSQMTKIASWCCSCTSDSTFVPAMCSGGKLHLLPISNDNSQSFQPPNLKECRKFSAVNDSPDSLPKKDRYWSVQAAIELSSGSVTSVLVTLRIWRIYPRNGTEDVDEPSHFLILGQDPSGVFLLIEVPNRPQIKTLDSLLKEGIGTTQTLTHLSVIERITDTQYPSLFSVIHSFKAVYKRCIASNTLLFSHLKDHLSKPPQGFCYKFTVDLGITSAIRVTSSDCIDVASPSWALEEAVHLDSGVRGSISVNILYHVKPFLYVISKDRQEKIYKILVKGPLLLPPWIRGDGTIMTHATLEDVAAQRGSLTVDEFSCIHRSNEGLQMSIPKVLSLIPEIGKQVPTDLVYVKGFIQDLNGDEACSWEECSICGCQELYTITTDNVKCQKCKTENISPYTKYSLEVVLYSLTEKNVIFKIKLFQTTIKTLLSGIQSQNKQYKMEDLVGSKVGPLICVIKSVQEKYPPKTFVLLELPY